MRVALPRQSRVVKKVLPRSLFGRSLLIVLIPLVIVQAVALQIFYGSHLNLVSRRFAFAIAGEIATTVDLLGRYPTAADRAWTLANAWDQYELNVHILPPADLPPDRRVAFFRGYDDDLAAALRERIRRPFTTDWETDPQAVLVRVALPDGMLDIQVPRKRLYTGTVYLFVLWLVGSALLLFGIAALFLRNQVRGIRRLAAAAEAFGLGRDIGAIKPEGAIEVRQAATAFNRMQDRIRRFLHQRTEMLAGVSHDLRTPLTRLRLALAMLPAEGAIRQDVADMTEDVDEMERMIGGYLAFARGEGAEQAVPTDLGALLRDIASRARRAGRHVALDIGQPITLALRPDSLRRALTNLVDNASRHAAHVRLAARQSDMRLTAGPSDVRLAAGPSDVRLAAGPSGGGTVEITVDDDGPGIPPERRETVFRPYATGAAGGTGLGLAIARDIVRAHGGEITLETSAMGGLRARVQLPT